MMDKKMEMWGCLEANIYHDEKGRNLIAEVGLPGVDKKDIKLEAGEDGFCVKAERGKINYDSCFCFDERVMADKTKAEFENGLLTMRAPINQQTMRAHKISIR